MASDTQATRTKSKPSLLCSGEFHLRFEAEQNAREAGRTAGAVGFATDVRKDGANGWLLVVTRRNQPFPLDELDRYSGRLRTIATTHGGAFERFVQE